MQSRKVFVGVVAETDAEGEVRPITIVWEDGRKFSVDRVTDIRRAYATKVGGTAIRYAVVINGKSTFLFYDDGKWFVESKI